MFKHTFNLFSKQEKKWLLLSGFIFLSIAVFFPTIYGQPFWDDWIYIFRNDYFYNHSFLTYFPGGKLSRSWPLFYTSMWFFLRIFGSHYFLYHLASLILHGINGFFIFRLGSQLKFRWPLLVAVLYMVHPAHLMTLGWIMQFKTILSIFFLLSAIQTLIWYYHSTKSAHYLLALFFFTCSLFSKATTVCFLFTVPFLYPRFKERIERKKLLLLTAPFIVIGLAALARTVWSYTGNIVSANYLADMFVERIHLSMKVFTRFIEILFIPARNILFQKRVQLNYTSREFLEIFVGISLVFSFGRIIFEKQNALLKGSFLFFMAALLPFCGIVDIPIFAFSNLVPYWWSIPALGLLPIIDYYTNSKKILIAAIVYFAAISHIQSYAFKSPDKILVDSIKHSPTNRTFYVALIEHYVYSGDCKKAQAAYEELTKLSATMEVPLLTKVRRCIPMP